MKQKATPQIEKSTRISRHQMTVTAGGQQLQQRHDRNPFISTGIERG